jgi:hypothetical protein
MRLLHDEPNPLNVLGLRELNFMPKHFDQIELTTDQVWSFEKHLDDIRRWIYNSLSGRFAIVHDLGIVDNKLESICKIGFEQSSEKSYFCLGCSVLHDHDLKII